MVGMIDFSRLTINVKNLEQKRCRYYVTRYEIHRRIYSVILFQKRIFIKSGTIYREKF